MTRPDLSKAIAALHSGGVIAYPTEAVFGLGCDPHQEMALARIIEIKGRDTHKGFILIAASQDQLTPFLAPVQAAWQTQFDNAWPGPVTFVVPARHGTSQLLSGSRDTLAVRVSSHPLVQRLCREFGGAIVSTSANRSGQEPCRDTASTVKIFGSQLDAIVGGNVGLLTSPTRIIDVRSGALIR